MKKFKIPSTLPTTTKSIRFPNDIIAAIDEEIKGKDCTFTAFAVEAVRAALETWKKKIMTTEPDVGSVVMFFIVSAAFSCPLPDRPPSVETWGTPGQWCHRSGTSTGPTWAAHWG